MIGLNVCHCNGGHNVLLNLMLLINMLKFSNLRLPPKIMNVLNSSILSFHLKEWCSSVLLSYDDTYECVKVRYFIAIYSFAYVNF
jgi:hypothetical protein